MHDDAHADALVYFGPVGSRLVDRGKKFPNVQQSAGWPNGKALDYESRDCRFDPCVGHFFSSLKKVLFLLVLFISLLRYLNMYVK